MPDIDATTFSGTKRGIDTYTHNDKVMVSITNSVGNVEGWNLYLTPENARQLAADLETLADAIDGQNLPAQPEEKKRRYSVFQDPIDQKYYVSDSESYGDRGGFQGESIAHALADQYEHIDGIWSSHD